MTDANIRTYRLILTGAGNVGRNLLEILHTRAEHLRDRYGVAFQLVGVADSRGAALDAGGLDLAALLAAKRAGQSVATLPGVGRAGLGALALVQQCAAEIVAEATPVSMADGQPGLDIARTALQRGTHVVLANKGPLALAYQELAALSDLASDQEIRRQGDQETMGQGDADQPAVLLPVAPSPRLRFSACVGGALPTINVGWRDLLGAQITRVEAVLNGTTQGILRMMETGVSYADALAEMQRRGIAEADPTLDVQGWDAASKLVILANAVLRQPTTLADLHVEGISALTADDLRAAIGRGERIVLLGLAEQDGARYRMSVRPTALPAAHPLARMSGDEMGVLYHTDIAGHISLTAAERDAVPTAGAMLRDMLAIAALDAGTGNSGQVTAGTLPKASKVPQE